MSSALHKFRPPHCPSVPLQLGYLSATDFKGGRKKTGDLGGRGVLHERQTTIFQRILIREMIGSRERAGRS